MSRKQPKWGFVVPPWVVSSLRDHWHVLLFLLKVQMAVNTSLEWPQTRPITLVGSIRWFLVKSSYLILSDKLKKMCNYQLTTST